jgi:hypothetical protein
MKYRITYLAGKLDTSVCPPAIVSSVFPYATPTRVELNESECIVEFAGEQTPADLGPLIKVELI